MKQTKFIWLNCCHGCFQHDDSNIHNHFHKFDTSCMYDQKTRGLVRQVHCKKQHCIGYIGEQIDSRHVFSDFVSQKIPVHNQSIGSLSSHASPSCVLTEYSLNKNCLYILHRNASLFFMSTQIEFGRKILITIFANVQN